MGADDRDPDRRILPRGTVSQSSKVEANLKLHSGKNKERDT